MYLYRTNSNKIYFNRINFDRINLYLLKYIILTTIAIITFCLSTSVKAEFTISTEGGLCVYDPCSDAYWFKLGGRLELDEIIFSGDFLDKQSNFPNSGNIRRAFIAFEGGVGEDFSYNMTFDFAPTVLNNVSLSDSTCDVSRIVLEEAWLAYTGLWECFRVRVGQFTPITTLDGYANYGLDNGQMFLESALETTAFSVPSYIRSTSRAQKGFGIILDTHLFDMWIIQATVYQPAYGPGNRSGEILAATQFINKIRSDRLGEAARIVYAPYHYCGCAYHFAAMFRHQALNHTEEGNIPIFNFLFATTPEVVPRNYTGIALEGLNNDNVLLTSPVIVDAGPLRTKGYNELALEAATIQGPVTLAAEYHTVTVLRVPVTSMLSGLAGGTLVPLTAVSPEELGNVTFYGAHVEGAYVVTGESRCYDFQNGAILGIAPESSWGAWEIAARYSYVNLNDKDVFGGSEHDATLGVNWFVNCHVRFTFNYIYASIRPTGFGNVAPRSGGAGAAQPSLLVNGFPPNTDITRRLNIFAARVQVVF